MATRIASPITDNVKHPNHYILTDGTECIEVIKSLGWFPDFCRASALKYLWRAGAKEDEVQDLRKAANYLTMLADYIEKGR